MGDLVQGILGSLLGYSLGFPFMELSVFVGGFFKVSLREVIGVLLGDFLLMVVCMGGGWVGWVRAFGEFLGHHLGNF